MSFKNSIIIMTSNLGSTFILDMGQDNAEAVKDMVMNTVSVRIVNRRNYLSAYLHTKTHTL